MKAITMAGLFILATVPALSSAMDDVSTSELHLYGVVDAGVASTHVSGGAGKGTRLGTLSGGQSDSLWGLTGNEDIGAGWQTQFGLESGFSAMTGQADESGRLFDYGSWVGLANVQWGEIRLGRQQTVGKNYGGGLEIASWKDMGMGALFKASDNYRRDHLVNIYSGDFSGWQAGMGYAFDAVGPDDPQQGRGHALSAGIKYESDPWLAVLTWDRLHPGAGSAASGHTPSAWQAGLSYSIEGWRASLAWTRQRDGFIGQDGGGIDGLGPIEFIQGGRADAYLVGVEAPVGVHTALLAQASMAIPNWHWEDGSRARRVQLYTLGVRQNLSPRSSLYAFVGRMYHGTLDDSFTSDAGHTTRLAVGLTHQF